MVMPKGDSLGLIAEYRAVTQQPEAVAQPNSTLVKAAQFFAGVTYVSFVDFLQRLWQMSMDEEGEDVLMIGTQHWLFPRRRVSQGVLDPTHSVHEGSGHAEGLHRRDLQGVGGR